MTRTEFEAMRAAATEILALHRAGQAFSVVAVQWARAAAVAQYKGPPAPPAVQREAVLRAMADAPPIGRLLTEIREITGMRPHQCATVLSDMVNGGHLRMIRVPNRSRYFLDEAALEVGRPLVDAMELARAAAKAPKPKPEAPPRRPAKMQPKVREPRQQREPRAPRQARSDRPRDQGSLRADQVGLATRYVVAATPADPRFAVAGPVQGIGAAAAWRAARAEPEGS
ncbi:hypothetical protein ABXN37_19815 [Piscinibacter sakaiensis]|uniref:Uncharacterized protein n=1 Tax=Piscinibacter sakaiensis TaxID=1547922 RepID=A0A0K8P427_PISS1|nr:hypothetical protein [Piscinibacter sakaiensis]GAP37372.1 hypothetical protein ISF6_3227 [Piscinibacter sakaiensis]